MRVQKIRCNDVETFAMNRSTLQYLVAVFGSMFGFGVISTCAQEADNILSAAGKYDNWILLFNDKTLDEW
jgi:hypothetical protein